MKNPATLSILRLTAPNFIWANSLDSYGSVHTQKSWLSLNLSSPKAAKPTQSEMQCAHYNIRAKNKSDLTTPIPEDSKNAIFSKKIYLEGGKLTLVFLAFLGGL